MTEKDKPRGGRRLTAAERELWSGVTRSVAPLRRRPPPPKPAAPEPALPQAVRKVRTIVAAPKPVKPSPGAGGPPALAPLDRRTRQKIARGTHPIDARLDLHGHTQGEAYAALSRFLHRCRDRGGKVVLVITGKGTFGGTERGVLKRQVPMWLQLPDFRDVVVGFENAAIGHGGEGALYVRLRRSREIRD